MPRKQPVGIISSVPLESGLLLKEAKGLRKTAPATATGRIGNNRVVHVESGIGIANAAHAATVLMEKYSPRAVVLMGIGGAYPGSGLGVGDVAFAEKEVYADVGVLTGDGPVGVDVIGIPLLKKGRKKYFNEFPMDRALLRLARKASAGSGIGTGVFLTVSQVSGTKDRADELARRFNAACENMEGAAVAHICALYGVPVLEVRGISNVAGDRDPRGWRKEEAARNCQMGVLNLLEAL
jgi:futalosine hydrolase